MVCILLCSANLVLLAFSEYSVVLVCFMFILYNDKNILA